MDDEKIQQIASDEVIGGLLLAGIKAPDVSKVLGLIYNDGEFRAYLQTLCDLTPTK